VAIKKGEHGCLLFGDPAKREFFSCPAYPLADLHDPTGAGDCFAGGLIGQLAREDTPEITFEQLKRAVVSGSVVASFNVEAFSLERLRTLEAKEVEDRYLEFGRISRF
jgi:sugar/nucleoside kinase (ribokinase family)